MDLKEDTAPKIVRLVSSDRQCWVCLGTEEDDRRENLPSEWTNPCRCRGSNKWVHQLCLQQWIDEKQKMSSSIEVKCPQCIFSYRVHYPTSSPFLVLYEYLDRAITFSAPVIFASLTASALYWMSLTHGITTIVLAMGKQEGGEYLASAESSLVVVTLPIIPWVVFGIKVIRPELQILRLYFRLLYQPLRSLLKVLPLTRSIAAQMSRDPHFVAAQLPLLPYVSRATLGALFLPFISSLVGSVFFRSVQSNVRKTLLGFLLYLTVSYSIKVTLEYHRGMRNRPKRPST